MANNNLRQSLAFFLVIAVALFGLIKITDLERKQLTTFETLYHDILAPLQGGVMSVSQEFSSYFRTLLELNQLKSRNEALQKEVDKLQGQLVEMENLRSDNDRFRKLLNFKDSSQERFQLEGAMIIARSSENWFNIITIDKGQKDGIAKNMAVLSPKGLVGHIISVANNSAQVLLILDPRSAVGSLLQTSRAPGVVEGLADVGNEVRMIYIPQDTPLKKGEMVITSGLGGVFPKGLPVGRVKSFKTEIGGLTKSAIIETFVNFNYLEEVFIVKKAWEPVNPQLTD